MVTTAPLGARAKIALRWRPQWRLGLVVLAAWGFLTAGGGVAGVHTHGSPRGHGPFHALVGLPGWVVMSVAMMAPATLPAVGHVGLNSLRRRRTRAMSVYFATYVGVWAAVGVLVLGLEHLAREHAGVDPRILLTATLAGAGAWQASRWKRRALYACGRTVRLPPCGRAADLGCVRFAWLQARRCAVSCWALMAAMPLVGHAQLIWMIALTLLILVEELTLTGRRLRLPIAAALGLLAVLVAVGA
jgi:predicted metal-binding membrane protein